MKKKKYGKTELPGYPDYPEGQDLFERGIKVDKIDPDDITSVKAPNLYPDEPNEKSFEDDVSGDDLDVPGSELDDKEEAVGSEDEENNYYSLGNDNNLDEKEDKTE
ncbi:MAG TPA: hypothetical protein PK536_02170 [Ignavibacteria bacterium]|nr:hypothetical protein [Bacteroidota bacterium]HRI84233.1 hypothetical protein [Ignavibacteria bacterium]HRJ99047.1 hypothetical protein [Ignavibacteria bacterium]